MMTSSPALALSILSCESAGVMLIVAPLATRGNTNKTRAKPMVRGARTRPSTFEAYTKNTVGGLARTWDCHIQRPVTPEDPVAFKEFLQSNPLFGGLEDLSLERVIAMLVEHSFPQGAMVCTEGEHGRSMYMVGRGEVEVRRSNSRGAQVPIVR